MIVTPRTILTLCLAALYGGISLLGYGLHSLVPHHGHHHGMEVCCASHDSQHTHHHGCGHSHGHCHHSHHHQHASCGTQHAEQQDEQGEELRLAASDGGCHTHLCGICAFLFKARSERVQVAPSIAWQHVVLAAPAAVERTFSSTSIGPHAPRGPPQPLV